MSGFARTEFEFLSRIGPALERLWQTGQMADLSLMLVLLVLLFGSYVQAVAGFALGMIAVAVIGGLRLLDIPTLAAIVSFLSLINAGLSLRGHVHEIHQPTFFGWAWGSCLACCLAIG